MLGISHLFNTVYFMWYVIVILSGIWTPLGFFFFINWDKIPLLKICNTITIILSLSQND